MPASERNGTEENNTVSTFGTAFDLPKVQKIAQALRNYSSMKLLLSEEQKSELTNARQELQQIVKIVDDFYKILGPRNWVFHEDMNLSQLALIGRTKDAGQAESELIAYYRDRETVEFLIKRLFRIEAFRPRIPLIHRAYKDFREGRYYACVLALIPVLDGSVNDVTKSKRRGLHARTPEEMVAWDSVTAHHLGLKHAQATFTKAFKKIVESEVFELYRHGIVHGMIINFDNEVVAAKALNRVFAIADWAESLLNSQIDPEQETTPSELINKMVDLSRAEKLNDSFQASEIILGEEAFDDHHIVNMTREFLNAWQEKNYGNIAKFFPKFQGESLGRRAGQAKDLYRDFPLSNYEITRLRNEGPILTVVNVKANINNNERLFTLRWVLMDENAQPVLPGKPGSWSLIPYGPSAFLKL